jgi:hypothetical protein
MLVLSLIGGHRRDKRETRDLSDTADSAKDPVAFQLTVSHRQSVVPKIEWE